MTKEEIVDEIWDADGQLKMAIILNPDSRKIYQAMDQYAKQECMELLEYMREELFIRHNPEEIYNLFLQSTAR